MEIKKTKIEMITEVPALELTVSEFEARIITAALAKANFDDVRQYVAHQFNDVTDGQVIDNTTYELFVKLETTVDRRWS